ncbi:MAG: DUF501 domain-containing protein [Actinomycetota bacterium]|nr:DUF501 domain-containing protein [Actinomycetota bacterium]
MTLDPRDQIAVEQQLGREPRGRWRVARRCSCGKPQVIETHPRLEDGTPFPTLWWLTCRALAGRVGQLESSGWMGELNERLATDPSFRKALAESTERYVMRRDLLERLGPTTHPGGGPERVKCLHAHTAHYLIIQDNPVGAEVLAALAWAEPKVPCV